MEEKLHANNSKRCIQCNKEAASEFSAICWKCKTSFGQIPSYEDQWIEYAARANDLNP